ncbi:WGR domain-containing protein, partial [Streptacidiphilus monticola]
MRRWEYVGDGSAKFWEAAVEGASVRVRYGRIGTDGREQVKELASAEAAEAHFGRLVAEKERKGYRQAGAPGAAASAETAPVPGGAGQAQ